MSDWTQVRDAFGYFVKMSLLEASLSKKDEAVESSPEQRLNPFQADLKPGCGRVGCACGLPLSERFALWALRQWQQDRALPAAGSILHRGFKMAGLLEVLTDFAIAMDAFAVALGSAGLRLEPPKGDSAGRLK
jgi:hypothetical protein